MFRRLIKAIGYDDYESVADEISQRNHDSLKYLIVASMPIGVLNIFVRECIVMGGGLDSVVVTSLHLLTILILMLVIPAKGKHGTVLIYLCEFLLLLVMLPPFIVDRPWRVFLHTTFWTVAFEVTSFMVKPAPIFRVRHRVLRGQPCHHGPGPCRPLREHAQPARDQVGLDPRRGD